MHGCKLPDRLCLLRQSSQRNMCMLVDLQKRECWMTAIQRWQVVLSRQHCCKPRDFWGIRERRGLAAGRRAASPRRSGTACTRPRTASPVRITTAPLAREPSRRSTPSSRCVPWSCLAGSGSCRCGMPCFAAAPAIPMCPCHRSLSFGSSLSSRYQPRQALVCQRCTELISLPFSRGTWRA